MEGIEKIEQPLPLVGKTRTKARRIAYEWLRRNKISKDDFLTDRIIWDDLCRELVEAGINLQHDPTKAVVRSLDKAGYLGAISSDIDFDSATEIVEARRELKRETGDPRGSEGIKSYTRNIATRTAPVLREYYNTPHWRARSFEYRTSAGWKCELCLRKHLPKSGDLVTHHLTYRFDDGSDVFNAETDDVLMAVCREPCHWLADIARYLRSGKLTKEMIETACQTLFSGLKH